MILAWVNRCAYFNGVYSASYKPRQTIQPCSCFASMVKTGHLTSKGATMQSQAEGGDGVKCFEINNFGQILHEISNIFQCYGT